MTHLANDDLTPGMVVSNFFTGHTPNERNTTRHAETVNTAEDAAVRSGSADAELVGYEVLGRNFAEANPGPTLLDYKDDWFIVNTYANAFGYDATPAQVDHFLAQEAYFTAQYGNVAQARGAVIGQILGWAVRTEDTVLHDAAGAAVASFFSPGHEYGRNLFAYDFA